VGSFVLTSKVFLVNQRTFARLPCLRTKIQIAPPQKEAPKNVFSFFSYNSFDLYYSKNPPFKLGSAIPTSLEAESTLTDRYQTTVSETVRQALHVGKRDKIHYTIRLGGEVVLSRAKTSEGGDPVLGLFLGFLARDIAHHPERLQTMNAQFVQRLQSLTGAIEVDLDAALSAADG
jgi:antitoxin PrlF